ncbi:MAG: hypothetical protein QMD65_03700 [Patescibacteria group bacterium]|nr:hypothetical protein [Patescibacteria group bacterium]
MDIVSHALWGVTVIRKKPLVWWALIFGILPDILSTGLGGIFLLFRYGSFWPENGWSLLPEWIKILYHINHSLLGVLIMFAILTVISRKILLLIIPYVLHIVIDLFTHEGDIIYRLFMPLINYNPNRVLGLNWWEHSWIWWLNIILLISANLIIWLIRRRREKKRAIG